MQKKSRLLLPVAFALAAALLVAPLQGCRSKQKTAPTPPPPATSASPTPTKPPFTLAEGSAELTAVIKNFYAGKPVPTSDLVAGALPKLKPIQDPPAGEASIGDWKGTAIASVKINNDSTFLIKNPQGAWHIAAGSWPSLGIDGPILSGKKLILFIGSDARPGETPAACRGDSLHIVGFDGARSGGVLGIARDTWTGSYKINAALTLGGPQAMMSAVESASNGQVKLDGYFMTGFGGFTTMIDELGGFDITSSEMVMTSGTTSVPGGVPFHLDSNQALAYSRERHSLPDGDFGRSRHQGEILKAGAYVLQQKGVTALPKLASIVGKYVETNLTPEQVMQFFATTYYIDQAAVGNKVCGGGIGTSRDGQSIVVPGATEQALYADIADGKFG